MLIGRGVLLEQTPNGGSAAGSVYLSLMRERNHCISCTLPFRYRSVPGIQASLTQINCVHRASRNTILLEYLRQTRA